jgi:hypothetical protein
VVRLGSVKSSARRKRTFAALEPTRSETERAGTESKTRLKAYASLNKTGFRSRQGMNRWMDGCIGSAGSALRMYTCVESQAQRRTCDPMVQAYRNGRVEAALDRAGVQSSKSPPALVSRTIQQGQKPACVSVLMRRGRSAYRAIGNTRILLHRRR